MGTPRATHDRNIAISKRHTSQSADGAGAGHAMTGAGTGESVESEGQAIWDEYVVMLFLWGNSRVVKERHLKKVEESTWRMEKWREGVSHVSV